MNSRLAFAPFALAACVAGEMPADGGGSGAGREAASTTPAPAPTERRTAASGGEATRPVPPAAEQAEGDACGAAKVRSRWTGALPDAATKAAIAAAVGDRPIRYYTEGDPVTMDFSEERLNVVLGADGRIAEFRCG
jgi:hypothetical protein